MITYAFLSRVESQGQLKLIITRFELKKKMEIEDFHREPLYPLASFQKLTREFFFPVLEQNEIIIQSYPKGVRI